MAKPDKQQVDYTSQIQVTGRSGLGAAAGYEKQMAENWSQIGNEFRGYMVEELKARNIEDALSLANQIQFDEKIIEADINGSVHKITMPSLIAPEGRIVGQSGLDAYKKIAAKTYVAELENDFATITETEANLAEDQNLTMQEFTANVTDKHNIIYENLPNDIVNLIRPDMEKFVIQRAARVQNQYLAFQNANQQKAFENLSLDYMNKITNLSNIGDAKTARMQQEQYFKHLEDGLALGNIKGITKEYIQQERARINGEVSFRLMVSQFSLKELNSRNLNHIRAEINNLTTLKDMLIPVPGMNKGKLVNPYTGKVLDISPDLIKEMISDPRQAEKIAVDLNVRLGHYNKLITKVDDISASVNQAQKYINARNAGVQLAKASKEDEKLTAYGTAGYNELLKDYNKNYQQSLSPEDSLTNNEFQITLMTDYNTMSPSFRNELIANLDTMNVKYLKAMYDSGFLSKMKDHKIKGEGGRTTSENLFTKYFEGHETLLMRITRALEQGESIEEIARVYTAIKTGDALTEDDLFDLVTNNNSSLPDSRAKLNAVVRSYYANNHYGVDEDRAKVYTDKLIRELQSDPATRALYISGNLDIGNEIYDRERQREEEFAIVKDAYIYNASGIDAHRAGYMETSIAKNKSIEQFTLPPIINGEFDYKATWNLDYMDDFIRMWMLNDPNIDWKTQFDVENLGAYVKKEFRPGGKIKLVPVSSNQNYPTYQLVHLNVDNQPTYVSDASSNPKEFNIGDIFQPAYKNIVRNDGFRQFLLERQNVEHDGKESNLSNVDVDSLYYKAGREWQQLKKSIDIFPDEIWTLGETGAAASFGAAAPYIYDMGKAALGVAKRKFASTFRTAAVVGPNIKVGPLNKEFKTAAKVITDKKTKYGFGWKGRVGMAVGTYLGLTFFSREIESFQQGMAEDPPYSITQMGNQLRYRKEEKDQYGQLLYPTQVPQWAIDAYDPDIDTYKFTEDYANDKTGSNAYSGSEGTVLLSAEINPETKMWIVYPNIRVVDGKRVLLSEKDAFDKAIKDKDYITFGPADDQNERKKALDFSRNFGQEVDYWRKNPNLEWWANGVGVGR